MKKNMLAIAAVALLAGPMTAGAIPYQIALTQDGLGDAGADWFGTFDAPEAGGAVTSLSVEVDGIAYSHFDWSFLNPFYYGTSSLFTNLISGMAGPIAFQPGLSTTVLQFDARNVNGVPVGRWSLSPCDPSSFLGCGGGAFLGSYSITPGIPTSVPEPGTLALFGLGFLGLGLTRRRRK